MQTAAKMLKKDYFSKCDFCNIFETTDLQPSGDLLHVHDYTQIWYVTRGACLHEADGQSHMMTAGDTFFVMPMAEHQTTLMPDSSVISCELDLDKIVTTMTTGALERGAIMDFIDRSKLRRYHFVFHLESTRQVGALMRELLTEYQEERPCYQDMMKLKIQQLLLLFIREFDRAPEEGDAMFERYRRPMEDAIAYIDDHYREDLTLEDICRVAALSRTYFCALFKQITGKTYVEYFTERRIHKAIELLEAQEMNVAQIGEDLGFHDPSNFSRTFKRVVGMSPTAYRRARITEKQRERV